MCGTWPADDGYKWRKYGQKSIKNSPNPRSVTSTLLISSSVFTHRNKQGPLEKTAIGIGLAPEHIVV